jgi:hypothetical protein
MVWTYSATGGNCTYTCKDGYSGLNCGTAPAVTPNSCAADPAFARIGALNIGTPDRVGMDWTYSATGGNCTYACTGGYSGVNCGTAPAVTPNSCAGVSYPYLCGVEYTCENGNKPPIKGITISMYTNVLA